MEIKKIVEKLGGGAKSAVRFNVHQYTIDRWCKTGIPLKYWDDIIAETGVKASDLYTANKNATQSKNQ